MNAHAPIAPVLADQDHPERQYLALLEDTAVSAHLLRAPTRFWDDLRRAQDFYPEGALVWWEVDVTLRRKTGGEKLKLKKYCPRLRKHTLHTEKRK